MESNAGGETAGRGEMNEQLANFFVSFTTTGVADIKTTLDDINNRLDALGGNFQESSKGMDGMFGGLTKLLGRLGLVTSAVTAVGLAIKNAFAIGDKAVELRNLSEATGASAEKLETLGIVLRKYGGDVSTAGEVYKNFMTMMTEYSQGKIPESHREMIARYGGYGLSIRAGMSPEQILENLNRVFNRLEADGNIGAIHQIARAYGLDQPTMVMLMQSQDDLRAEIERAKEQLVLSSEETQKSAEELRLAKQELRAVWDRVSAELIPILSSLLDALSPILEALAPIAQWVLKQIGGTIGGAVDVASAIFTDKTMDEVLDKVSKQDNIYGALLRSVDNVQTNSAIMGNVWEPLPYDYYEKASIATGVPADILKTADEELKRSYMNKSLWELMTTSNTDNRSVNVGAININGDTGSIRGIRDSIGGVVRGEMGALIAGSTMRGGV